MTQYQVGDILFIAIDNPLYRRVAAVSGSWTSHVGLIFDATPGNEIVAESSFPLSKKSSLESFKARSLGGQYAAKRLQRGLSEQEKAGIREAAEKRMGILYHTGFKLDSKRQFCSKFVYEIYREAVGLEVGSIETFHQLLRKQEKTPLWFWHLWYFGFVPWERRTVTPASLHESPLLVTIEECHRR